MRPSRLIAVAGAVAFVGAAAVASAQQQAPSQPSVEQPTRVARHAAQATGWARTTTPGVRLSPRPDPAAEPGGDVPSTRVAGEVVAVQADSAGGVWVQVRYPDRVSGWVRGTELRTVPTPRAASRTAQVRIDRAMARLGPGAALVVRDPFGRTLVSSGTSRALSLASVTKLATMAAALRTRPVPAHTTRAILGASDNAAAQRLSTSLGGGSRAAGARITREAVAELGARVRLVDGSGLSPGNRASALEITDLLIAMRDQPRFATFLGGLAVAARSGTLAGRMHGTSAAGRVRAKTGTLFDHPTSSLCGYVWPAGAGMSIDRALVVCMLENGVSPYRARPAQDEIAQALTAPGAFVSG